jgi:FdhE protein
MRDSWERRIERAQELAAADPATASLLEFYAKLLTFQKALYEFLRTRRGWLPSGSLERDLDVVRVKLPALLGLVAEEGPEPLAAAARGWADGPPAVMDDILTGWWRSYAPSASASSASSASSLSFFPKAALQPYAQWLAETGVTPVDRAALDRAENRCPFCGGLPQLSILTGGGDLEGGGRSLLCATCLTPWTFRRVVCAWCGEEDDKKLGYFHASSFDHLRVDACDTCRHYLKSVDLTRLGLAVPLVDEIAGAALDLWARERGYEKIEVNLLGL